MTEFEQYEFDRVGYIVIPDMLDAAQVAGLAAAVDRLEAHAADRVNELLQEHFAPYRP